MVTKDKHCYLHFKFFLLYPFFFSTMVGYKVNKTEQDKRRPCLQQVHSSVAERCRNALCLQDVGHLPEEMTETNLKKLV